MFLQNLMIYSVVYFINPLISSTLPIGDWSWNGEKAKVGRPTYKHVSKDWYIFRKNYGEGWSIGDKYSLISGEETYIHSSKIKFLLYKTMITYLRDIFYSSHSMGHASKGGITL